METIKINDFKYQTDFWVELEDDEMRFQVGANVHGHDFKGNYYDAPESREVEIFMFDEAQNVYDLQDMRDLFQITDTQIENLEEEILEMDSESSYDSYEERDYHPEE